MFAVSEGIPINFEAPKPKSEETKLSRAKKFLLKLVRRRQSSTPKLNNVPAEGDLNYESAEVVTEELNPALLHLHELSTQPLISLESLLSLPEGSRSKGNVIANLVANNRFEGETETEFIQLNLKGNLIGVGAASIFCMVEAFDECKSFTAIDVHPSPVAIGRVLVEILKEKDTFEEFFAILSDEEQLKIRLTNIGLPEDYFDETTESVRDAIAQYKKV